MVPYRSTMATLYLSVLQKEQGCSVHYVSTHCTPSMPCWHCRHLQAEGIQYFIDSWIVVHLGIGCSIPYRIGPDSNCTNQVTSCKACYFAREERPLPNKCSTNHKKYSCAGLTQRKQKTCLRRWAKCLKNEFKDIFGKVCMVATTVNHKLIDVTLSTHKVDMHVCYQYFGYSIHHLGGCTI